MNKEIRSGQKIETRNDDGLVKVSGYAATFNNETDIGGYYIESIAPGAFADAIGTDDVRFLINHEGLPLARTKSGTLTLKEDERGLFMETELNTADPDVQSIIPKMERGDLNEMSFAFMPTAQEWDDSGDIPKRTITKAQLFDVAIVTYPAYDSTEIGLRNLSEHRKETENHSESNEVIKIRMKMDLALRGQ